MPHRLGLRRASNSPPCRKVGFASTVFNKIFSMFQRSCNCLCKQFTAYTIFGLTEILKINGGSNKTNMQCLFHVVTHFSSMGIALSYSCLFIILSVFSGKGFYGFWTVDYFSKPKLNLDANRCTNKRENNAIYIYTRSILQQLINCIKSTPKTLFNTF